MMVSDKKVIRASAGTGKTYRLSLEFVNLLLSKPVQFDEILVITFTKKATSEIRNSILSHLQNILQGNDRGEQVKRNIFNLFGREIDAEDIKSLKAIYRQMLINKHKLHISTIDSFIASIFTGIISPYLGINDFEVNNEINKHYLPEIYTKLLYSPDFTNEFVSLFKTSKLKTIESYDDFILSIVNNRWLIEMVKKYYSTEENRENFDRIKEFGVEYKNNYIQLMKSILKQFSQYLYDDNKQGESSSKIVKKIYDNNINIKSDNVLDWLDKFSNCITSNAFLEVYWKTLIEYPQFWNGNKCLKKNAFFDRKEQLISLLDEAVAQLANYIFCTLLLDEQSMVIDLADKVLEVYDTIKKRERIFTYSDISYYTFKHLYDPELSLIDQELGTVENRFYEYLATNTRYMLIDEYQDTSIVQHKILLPIITELISGYGAKEYGGVIVVGDEKQSIYGWRSGERELLLKIPTILQNAQETSLTISYRSTAFIMQFINSLFSSISKDYSEVQPRCTDNYSWIYETITANDNNEDGAINITYYNTTTSKEIEPEDPHRYFVEHTVQPHIDSKKNNTANSVILAHTNKDLENISNVLEENNIPHFREGTVSVIHHQAVKPLIYLLKFIAYKNVLYLLQFLRSDVCLIEADELKRVIKYYNEDLTCFTDLAEIGSLLNHPALGKISKLTSESTDCDLLALITLIIQEFNFTRFFPEEYNLKNMNLFLEVASEYMTSITGNRSGSNIDHCNSIGGFLDYLDNNEKSDKLMQKSLQSTNVIQLLSVHKAKGLQFETVFYYCKDNKGYPQNKTLKYYYSYNELLTDFIEGYLTFNYDQVLKNTTITDLYNTQKSREFLEKLNVIYVALTRAEKNIFLFLPYKHRKGIEGYINSLSDKDVNKWGVYEFFFNKIADYIKKRGYNLNNDSLSTSVTFGCYEESVSTVNESVSNKLAKDITAPSKNYFSFDNRKKLQDPQEEKYFDYYSVHVVNKYPLMGEIVHYYLSYIKYATKQELDYAHNRTVSLYGNIIHRERIVQLINRTDAFIGKNKHLFTDKWKVFTEYVIFDNRGKEYRIDRLMIDEIEYRILIIDYKTGFTKDENQLPTYKSLVSNLSYVKKNKYLVETAYVEISI